LRDIEKNPKNIDRRGLCQEVLSSCYRANKKKVFQGEKSHEMNATKIDTKPTIKEACYALKHINNSRSKTFLDKNTY